MTVKMISRGNGRVIAVRVRGEKDWRVADIELGKRSSKDWRMGCILFDLEIELLSPRREDELPLGFERTRR